MSNPLQTTKQFDIRVLTEHGDELQLFWAKVFPLIIRQSSRELLFTVANNVNITWTVADNVL